MKQLIFFILAVFLIGIASAEISISPSQIDLGNVFPNQVYQQSITITTDVTDDGYDIILESNNSYVTISPNEFLVNGTLTAIINLTFADNTPISHQTSVVIIPSGSSGGGGHRSYYSPKQSSENLIINNSDVCERDAVECFGDSIYYCEGFGWRYIKTCEFGCNGGECLEKIITINNVSPTSFVNETSKEVLNKDNNDVIVLIIVIFLIIITFIIVIYIIEKRTKNDINNDIINTMS